MEKVVKKGAHPSILPADTLLNIKLIWSAYSRTSEAQVRCRNLCAVWDPLKENEKETSSNRKYNNNKKKIKISKLLSDKKSVYYSKLAK